MDEAFGGDRQVGLAAFFRPYDRGDGVPAEAGRVCPAVQQRAGDQAEDHCARGFEGQGRCLGFEPVDVNLSGQEMTGAGSAGAAAVAGGFRLDLPIEVRGAVIAADPGRASPP
jgi:hypothetical protein